jgi:ceramide glucosyltransferase
MASLAVAWMSFTAVAGLLLYLLAAAGILYVFASAAVFRRFFRKQREPESREDPVTLLKPLCGAEPSLAANLRSFLAQEHHGPIQLVCGVAARGDEALDAVETLRGDRPENDIVTVVSAVRHGASPKVSNVANMFNHATHPIVILSDSDMVAAPTYLAHVLTALAAPGVGAVTLLYRGRGDAGFWSRVGAAGLSYQFLPGAVFGVALGIANPCMGSTIALTRATVHRIGGFGRFANELADDYAIGAAVRALRLKVAVPPLLMTHASSEAGFVQWLRHELRWGATIRQIVPAAYVGSIIAMPVPLALAGLSLSANVWVGGPILALALVARLHLMATVDAQVGERTAPWWLLPLRDCLTMVVFVASLFVRKVDWRGKRHAVIGGGQLGPDTELVV